MDLLEVQSSVKEGIADVLAGHLAAVSVGLYKTDIELTEGLTFADLDAVKANYTGYAAEAVTWSAVTVSDDGEVELIGVVGEFRPTGMAVTNTVYGAYVFDPVATTLKLVGRFDDAPLPMASADDAILVTLRYRLKDGSLAVVVS